MTFNALEISEQSGEPRELYDFQVGVQSFTYTSADTDTVWLTDTYTAAQIDRTEIEETEEISRNDLSITCPRNLPIAELFRVAPPSDVVMLQLFKLHVGDTERKLIWAGRVLGCNFEGVKAVLSCESIYTSMRRPGLRRQYQRSCPHVLYGGKCGVSDVAYKLTKTVLSVSGATINFVVPEISPLGDGYLAGGFIRWEESAGVYAMRAIRSHVGDVITITHPIPGLGAGATPDLYPGCDHTLDTCNSKFANSVNYGGMPYIPAKNPFGPSSIF